MIASTGSSCGKTTMVCGFLKALKDMGKNIVSFKCGPDYVDPMFHKKVLAVPSYNLDVVMVQEDRVKYLLKLNSKDMDFALIEGVMGLYDGIGNEGYGSCNYISIITETPVLLVVNATGKFNSVCAEISGYLNYKSNNIKGIILNNVSNEMYERYKSLIEKELNVKVVGYLPKMKNISIDSRYLGLVLENEIDEKINILGDTIKKTIDFDLVFELSKAPEIKIQIDEIKKIFNDLNIYISKDEAFCFLYDDNIKLLKMLGANIHYFSPISDNEIPEHADGIMLFGGYPELFAKELSENIRFKNSIKSAVNRGVPVYAEGGGFMYLQESITDIDNNTYPMVSAVEGKSTMTNKNQNFGYLTLVSNKDNLMCKKNEKISAHEFHYSKSTNNGDAFTGIKRRDNSSYQCIIGNETLYAGYPQINFWSNPDFLINFLKKCEKRKGEVNEF